MRLLLSAIVTITLTGCTQKKWDKETLVNNCLSDFTKRNEKEKIFTTLQLAHVCDCIAGKMFTKYKSAKESDKDEAGMQKIGYDCAGEVMGKEK